MKPMGFLERWSWEVGDVGASRLEADISDTVDASEIRRFHQVRLVVNPIIYTSFIHPRW